MEFAILRNPNRSVAHLNIRCEMGQPCRLQVVDQEGGSTVWDDLFPTDEEALAEAMNTIETEGIGCFLRDPANRLQ